MKSYKLVISTPNGNAYENDVVELSVRGTEGSLAVRAGHVPFITAVVAGQIKIIDKDENEASYEISDGILTVAKDKTTILCGSIKE